MRVLLPKPTFLIFAALLHDLPLIFPGKGRIGKSLFLVLPLFDWRPLLVPLCLVPVFMVLESLAKNLPVWNTGHPFCKCRLLCRCKEWIRKTEGMDFHGCFSLSKEDSKRVLTHFIEFLFTFYLYLLPPNIIYLLLPFKLFRKPKLSCRFKE